jgi:prophage antirepressor-like protein
MKRVSLLMIPQKWGMFSIWTSGNPSFPANEVVKSLGYARPGKAIFGHGKGVTVLGSPTKIMGVRL